MRNPTHTPFLSSRTGAFQDTNHFRVASSPGMEKRGHAVAIRQIDICACGHQQPNNLGMARAAVAEEHGFEECRPSEIIDMIPVDRGREQDPHSLDMAAVTGRDEGGAAKAVHTLEVRAGDQHQLQDFGPALGTGDKKWRILDKIPDVDVCTFVDEQPGDVDVIALRRREQSRAATAIARVHLRALGEQIADNDRLAPVRRTNQCVLRAHRRRACEQDRA